nr:hypothetical protein [uncultured Peptostreptococcus sp.]
MAKYCPEKNIEVDVVFSVSGRLRMRVVKEPNNPLEILNKLKEKTKINIGRYTGPTKTFVLEYDKDLTDLNELILTFCGLYSRDIKENQIKLNYKLSNKHAMGYSSLVSLAFIIIDLGMNFMGLGGGPNASDDALGFGMRSGQGQGIGGRMFGNMNTYRNFVRWGALVTTTGAIFEHGYKELNEKGAFDPEVMSIMYLIRSMNRGTVVNDETNVGLYSPAIAWLLTFGRHILTRQERSIIIDIFEDENGEIKVVEEESKSFFFNKFISSCFDVYQNVNFRRGFMR